MRGRALGQSEGLRLDDIVVRPDGADVGGGVVQHAQQHGARLTVGDRFFRGERAVGVAADDLLFSQIGRFDHGRDVARRPVGVQNVGEQGVALVGGCIAHAERSCGELGKFGTGQAAAGFKVTRAVALHDGQCVERSRCLCQIFVGNILKCRPGRTRKQRERQGQADKRSSNHIFPPLVIACAARQPAAVWLPCLRGTGRR